MHKNTEKRTILNKDNWEEMLYDIRKLLDL